MDHRPPRQAGLPFGLFARHYRLAELDPAADGMLAGRPINPGVLVDEP